MNEAHSSCERTRTRSRGADTKREGGDQLFFVQLFLFGSFSAPSSPLFPPPPSSHPPTCCLPLCLTTPRGPPARSPTTFAADTSSPARVIASLGSYCSPSSSHLVSASWEGGMRWKGRHLGRSPTIPLEVVPDNHCSYSGCSSARHSSFFKATG